MLCERGIRTFETATRNTLDIAAIPVLKRETHLPVIVDPSHAGGDASLVAPLAFAAIAAGADGLIVEVHPDPECALSDGDQSLAPPAFEQMMGQLDGVRRRRRPNDRCTRAGAWRSHERRVRQGRRASTELARCRDEIERDRPRDHRAARRASRRSARRTGELKRAAGLPILDPTREAAVIRRVDAAAREAGLPPEPIREVFWQIVGMSRRAQEDTQ